MWSVGKVGRLLSFLMWTEESLCDLFIILPGYGGRALVGAATGGLFATGFFFSLEPYLDCFFFKPGFGTDGVDARAESGFAFADVNFRSRRLC